jgi:uncharacterized protein (DUF1800 family)
MGISATASLTMPPTTLPMITRRDALGATVAALAWRPALAAGEAGAATGAAADALHALNRIGFGPAPGDLERVTQMGAPAWIAEQLHPERLALPAFVTQQLATLQTPRESQRELVQRYREMQKAARQARLAAKDADPATASEAGKTKSPERNERREMIRGIYLEAGESRLLQSLNSPRQLEEAMVDFWFNHFNVYEGKGLVRVLTESYEREAIRPNVFGKFRTLLGATARHPAMLFYLDNWLSVAPGYQPRGGAGKGRGPSGLNENYAREVMELHTLGVDGGYTQQDVTELARILTGWTLAGRDQRRRGAMVDDTASGRGDSIFEFDPARHDNGTKNWLGHIVPPGGRMEGEFALDVLARHPATAKHVATKLARRFVADDPSRALVDRLAQRFLDTDGDIRGILETLFDSPEFRDPRPVKFKTPYQYVLSAVRATGIPATNVRPLLATLTQLGQPLFGCQTPDGYKDTEADWLNPDAITRRVDFATALASGRLPLLRLDDRGRVGGMGLEAMQRETDRAQREDSALAGSTPPVDAGALLAALGPAISAKTRGAIAGSDPALRAALVLGSPDFMRR